MTTLHMVIGLIALLQVLDAATTIYALRQPRLVEGNGLMAKWFGLVGLVPGLITVKLAFVAWVWWAAPSVPVELLCMVCLGYVWVVWHNIKLISKS